MVGDGRVVSLHKVHTSRKQHASHRAITTQVTRSMCTNVLLVVNAWAMSAAEASDSRLLLCSNSVTCTKQRAH
jgi:hypothetical protein